MEEEYSSQFFNTVPEKEGNGKHQILDDKKLELRLAPPGGGEFLDSKKSNSSRLEEPVKRQFDSSWLHGSLESSGFTKEAQVESQGHEKKKRTNPDTNVSHKRAAPAPAPVVGWPPIRSFRKNLQASSTTTSKAASASPPPPPDTKTQIQKDIFVKINMEGVPIGRKINLNA